MSSRLKDRYDGNEGDGVGSKHGQEGQVLTYTKVNEHFAELFNKYFKRSGSIGTKQRANVTLKFWT